jgi:hypothetical protein
MLDLFVFTFSLGYQKCCNTLPQGQKAINISLCQASGSLVYLAFTLRILRLFVVVHGCFYLNKVFYFSFKKF